MRKSSQVDHDEHKIKLIFEDATKMPFTVDEENKTLIINTFKIPYTPKNVYKAF
jgi:hypothetical protein